MIVYIVYRIYDQRDKYPVHITYLLQNTTDKNHWCQIDVHIVSKMTKQTVKNVRITDALTKPVLAIKAKWVEKAETCHWKQCTSWQSRVYCTTWQQHCDTDWMAITRVFSKPPLCDHRHLMDKQQFKQHKCRTSRLLPINKWSEVATNSRKICWPRADILCSHTIIL